jgi:hypothetical protein
LVLYASAAAPLPAETLWVYSMSHVERLWPAAEAARDFQAVSSVPNIPPLWNWKGKGVVST